MLGRIKVNSFFSDIAGNLVDKLPPIIGKYGYDFVKKFYHDNVSMLGGIFPLLQLARSMYVNRFKFT